LIYRFDRYELDDDLFELRVDSEVCSLPRKSFDLLRYLLHHSDRVVTKDELFAEIWAGEHVTESVLPVNVRTIRKLLGEERSERILKTVRGRGYRIMCRVERLDRSAPAATAAAVRGSFVGRDALMDSLRRDYADAVAGEGRIVLLFGEAGIGKSRMLDEFMGWCRAEGGLLLQVRCPEDPGAPPFWPVLRMMEEGYELLASPEFRERVEQSGLDLERARKNVVEFLQDSSYEVRDLASARFQLTQAVVRIVERVSRVAPTCMVIDDLHCMDEGTARVCEAVAREIPNNRVMVLGAYRDSELRRGSILAQTLGSVSGQEGLRQVRLRGLDREAVGAFVLAETGIEPSDELLETLCERTEGNPFFLRETLRLLAASGDLEASEHAEVARLGLAQGIRETIGRRLDTLSQDCNKVLSWASVIGRRFAFPILKQVCDIDSTRLLELLASAEEAHIITSARSSGDEERLPLGEFAFAHGLVRETIYEDMSGPERVLRHRAVAEAIERLYGGAASERVFELAKHFFEAAPGGDINRAVDYCLRAARHAAMRYAHEDAARYFDHALRAEELRVPRDDLRFCCVVLGRADALWRAGAYVAAQPEFRRAASLARDLRRFDLLGYAALGLVEWPRFNRISFAGSEPDLDREQIIALIKEALAGLGENNPSLRARLTAVLVRTALPVRRREQSALADEAVRLARAAGDERALFHGLLSKLSAMPLFDAFDECLTVATELVTLADQQRAPTRLFASYEARIPLLLAIGDMELADADIAAARAIAERMSNSAYTYSTDRFELARALGDGRMDCAAGLIERMQSLGRQVDDPGAEWGAVLMRFWILASRGTRDKLKEALDDTDPTLLLEPQAQSVAAYFYMLAGETRECRSYFERVAGSDFSALPRDISWLWHLACCADVALYLDDKPRVEALYDMLEPYVGFNIITRLYCYRGAVAQPLASLAAALGKREEAFELLESALAFNRRIGAQPSIIWTQAVYASLLEQGSSSERAKAEFLWKVVERSAAENGIEMLVEGFQHWASAAG